MAFEVVLLGVMGRSLKYLDKPAYGSARNQSFEPAQISLQFLEFEKSFA
jgi:hypothetical protein